MSGILPASPSSQTSSITTQEPSAWSSRSNVKLTNINNDKRQYQRPTDPSLPIYPPQNLSITLVEAEKEGRLHEHRQQFISELAQHLQNRIPYPTKQQRNFYCQKIVERWEFIKDKRPVDPDRPWV